MQKLIKTTWCLESGKPYQRARILHHKAHPEGLDLDRIRFLEKGLLPLNPRVGHTVSVIHGSAYLKLRGTGWEELHLGAGVHLYLPAGQRLELEGEPGTELLRVSSPCPEQSRGNRLLVRDEIFLAACATESQCLRWSFTPHYLSRRIFLHHDQTLLSKAGTPVSWFRTTIFDTAGLTGTEEGKPVFRISYNSRTELNVCYEVKGEARVRMARHPYLEDRQQWGPWLELDNESAYHLDEVNEEECHIDQATESLLFFRNKHELQITGGYLGVFSLFDPAPTGIENASTGNCRDEAPLAHILGTRTHENHLRELARFDEMVDQLSLAKARGNLAPLKETPIWDLYLKGCKAQAKLERTVVRPLFDEGNGRERLLADWMQQVSP
jgi:hypothetical protein